MEPFLDTFIKAIGSPKTDGDAHSSSTMLPSISWSSGVDAIHQNCSALGAFESSRSWRSAGPLLVAESAMHIDEMPVRMWKMPGIPEDEGVALCGTFIVPCIDVSTFSMYPQCSMLNAPSLMCRCNRYTYLAGEQGIVRPRSDKRLYLWVMLPAGSIRSAPRPQCRRSCAALPAASVQ